jgi:tRNA A-37 threonylcarbamoyl transferase component Bud32
MSPSAFEEHLRSLSQTSTLVRRTRDRETWVFSYNNKPYFLHFYPHTGRRFSRSAASAEFAGLKTLQDFKLPGVRVAALLSGFNFDNRRGDAVITHGLSGAQRLDTLVGTLAHREVLLKTIDLLHQLGQARIGHTDLRPSAFAMTDDRRVVLLDGRGIHTSGLTTEHLLQFAHAIGPGLTRADRVRAWRRLVPGSETPPVDKHRHVRFQTDYKNDDIAPVRVGDWTGRFRVRSPRERAWSVASRTFFRTQDWINAWPEMLRQIDADQLEVLKRDSSGDILSGRLNVGGVWLDVIVKCPRNKFLYRYVLDIFRASRAARLWDKTRWLQIRDIDVEYPLLLMERRTLGYVTRAIAVFERVPGSTLDATDLNTLTDRASFFSRCGRILRRIEQTGLAHTDAKSSNWIVLPDRQSPVLIDSYGVRRLTYSRQLCGIRRLLRAMKNHPQFTPDDSLSLCTGFAPITVPVLTETQAGEARE